MEKRTLSPEEIKEITDTVSSKDSTIDVWEYLFDYANKHKWIFAEVNTAWVDHARERRSVRIFDVDGFDIIEKPKMTDQGFADWVQKKYKKRNIIFLCINFWQEWRLSVI